MRGIMVPMEVVVGQVGGVLGWVRGIMVPMEVVVGQGGWGVGMRCGASWSLWRWWGMGPMEVMGHGPYGGDMAWALWR